MAKNDPELRLHKDWLGLLQPIGLVVSPPALVKGQAVPSQNVAELQHEFLAVVEPPTQAPETDPWDGDDRSAIRDLVAFLQTVLNWSLDDIAGAPDGPPIPEGLELVLPDYNETLRPTYVVVDSMGDGQPMVLVQVLELGTELDKAPEEDRRTGWPASPQVKLERLMREVKVATGLLCNGDVLRLIHAPSGESSGHLTFPVAAMSEVGGRPILAALHMLLSEYRVFSAPSGRRLLDLLAESRKYQAEVSNALSDQVLGALWELLRGFQASDPEDGYRIFDETAREDPEHVYGGLLTLLMRLIFVLYAEDQGLMPKGEVYANNYSVAGLFGRLRSDEGRYPDTMDQRYGAYAWLLSLFRLVFDGGGHGGFHLPTRHGQLFNPDEFPFLEGRSRNLLRVMDEKIAAPRVSDGCLYRVLDALLMLHGERLSYRALDVEQIGSVYEAMMGYEVERAFGASIAVRPKHIVVDIDALLEIPGAKRAKWLKDQALCDLSRTSAAGLKTATTAEEMVAALGRRVSPRSLDASGMPYLMAPGSLYLQPGEERRRTGSHYTPRELTEPIVRTTLRPVLEALGERPEPEQILDLKVCDPAMGSGAFLVEACRQLAEHLVTAWEIHDAMPEIPPDEEPLLHARRLVAQRCLYGVDKNPFAVSLAKLSLWLVTLARDHAFTFLDHALKNGDSLIGLTRKQIAAFHWKPKGSDQSDWIEEQIRQDLEEALGWRDALQGLDEGDYNQKRAAWWEAENELANARLIGNLVIAAFFEAPKKSGREKLRNIYLEKVEAWRSGPGNRLDLEVLVKELRQGERAVQPLHWEIEFPEVFGRASAGFDAVIGNPPFLGGRRTTTVLGEAYRDFLALTPSSSSNSDIVAFFFRQSFELLETHGCSGLVATNTIGQGDTRTTGLQWITENGGEIYSARRRVNWPGVAAVIVSVVHFSRGAVTERRFIDEREAPQITAFLFHCGGNKNPSRLFSNSRLSFQGSILLGMGFTFDDADRKGIASPTDELRRLVEKDNRNAEKIFPYLGGQEVNNDPAQRHHRFVVNFGNATKEQAQLWPDLLAIVKAKVEPERRKQKRKHLRERWWQHAETRPALFKAIENLERVLVTNCGATPHLALALVSARCVFANTLVIFPLDTYTAFCCLQARPHETWARFFGSSMKDDLRYTPSDCFETFPFPRDWHNDPILGSAGKTYYEFRGDLMLRSDKGLTKTYNHFHDPDERDPDILKLRDLHTAMDRAVLDSYGWTDIPTDCEFLLDYEIDEETWGKKKKPYRYRWPEDVHDEVLARLLDLNQKRYAEEVAAGLHAEKGKKKVTPKKKKKTARPSSSPQLALFDTSPNPPEKT